MSADPEREAREQQKKAGFLSQPQDLYACQHEHGCAAFLVDEVTGYFYGQPCDCGANSRWGDLASKRMRANEREIEELRARKDSYVELLETAMDKNECLSAEIATLRARVAELEGMVPRWAPVLESLKLFRDGWKVVPIYPEAPGYILFCPPIPAPETKA